MDIAISVQHVYKDFNGEQVLKDVHHDFETGKIHGIVGNNGSGKTVLFKCICGFLFASKGKIFIDYEQVGKDMDFPDDMGIIIETPGFLPGYSGLRNLELLASIRKKVRMEEVKKFMNLVGLDANDKKQVGKYSLGMKQRLGIAQAIMENPQILILDEPMNGLDEIGVSEIRNTIKEFKNNDRIILLASII